MIEIRNIEKSFGEKKIFENFSLVVEDGSYIVITGKSGSGKTTLLNLISGIDMPDAGEIIIEGYNTRNKADLMKIYREKIGFIFQNFALVDNKTVLENLMFVEKKCRTEISVSEALEKVGLSGFEDRKVYTLSGGEQQRVALARLFIKKSKIILADEPTGNLDDENAKKVLGLIREINGMGKTILMVTHDERITKYADKVITI